jgi:hypothetical protein
MDEIRQGAITAFRQDWIESLSYDDRVFRQHLVDLGLDMQSVDSDLRTYQRQAKVSMVFSAPKEPHGYTPEDNRKDAQIIGERKRSFLQSIRDLIARREYRVENSTIWNQRVPLFWLTCPNAKRSKVHYKEEVTEGLEAVVDMTVFGTGMGADQNVSIAYSSEFEANDGECKTIFVRFPLRISLVSVYEKEALVGKGLRSEVPDEQQNDFKLGIESESKEDSEIAYRASSMAEEWFELSGDTSRAIHAFSCVQEKGTRVDIKSGLKAFDLEFSSKIKIQRKNKIKLTFKLPAGLDYHLKRALEGSGIWWG